MTFLDLYRHMNYQQLKMNSLTSAYYHRLSSAAALPHSILNLSRPSPMSSPSLPRTMSLPAPPAQHGSRITVPVQHRTTSPNGHHSTSLISRTYPIRDTETTDPSRHRVRHDVTYSSECPTEVDLTDEKEIRSTIEKRISRKRSSSVLTR